jgi:hypothetical protein
VATTDTTAGLACSATAIICASLEVRSTGTIWLVSGAGGSFKNESHDFVVSGDIRKQTTNSPIVASAVKPPLTTPTTNEMKNDFADVDIDKNS